MADVDPAVPAVRDKFEALVVDMAPGETGDVIASLRIPRETLALGGKIPLSFVRRVPCDPCKGGGRAEGAPPCATCDGKGRISKDVTDDGETSTFVSTCEACDGRGHAGEHACKACERGFTKVDASVEVEVPAGSGVGMQLRVQGQGHIRPGKPQGDVVVVLAAAAPEMSPAAQKLPSFILLVVITIVILVLALRMAR